MADEPGQYRIRVTVELAFDDEQYPDVNRAQYEVEVVDRRADVARIEHAYLNGFEMSHDAEGGDGLHEPPIGPANEQIGYRRPAGENQKQTKHD